MLEKIDSSLDDGIVLLACGAFSPPTIMHFRMMEMAREHIEEKLDVRVAGGVFSPVHDRYNKPGLISAEHRLNMLEMACAASEWLQPWDFECSHEDGWMRTAQVIGELERATRRKVMLVAGEDILDSFNVPNLWSNEDIEAIVKRGIVIIERSTGGTAVHDTLIIRHPVLFRTRWGIHFVPQYILNAISSTRIRMLLSRGLSISYLVDKRVEDYIIKNRLYI